MNETPFQRRHWTPNERRYVQRLARGQRLKFRVALSVIGVLWLGLLAGFVFFVYNCLTERSLFSGFAALVALLVVVIIAGYVFPRYWRAGLILQDSPWVDPMQGKLSVLEGGGFDGPEYRDAIGGREVRFPSDWLDHLREGDEVHALRYAMDVASDRTGVISVILALDNGFSIDEEVRLGLIDVRSPRCWVATLVAGVLWWLAPTLAAFARLRPTRAEMFWIPAALTTLLALLAVRRTLLDVAIHRRLVTLRRDLVRRAKKSR